MDETPGDPPVEARVGTALRAADQNLAIAESCTGGLVGSLVTDTPGASDYFDRSVVTYSYAAKREVLAIDRELLDSEGAVSEPVARAMAKGIRDMAGTTWGLSTTGIAGPTGGTDDQPVGTVLIGVAYAAPWGTGGSFSTVNTYVFDGDRRKIKHQIAQQALEDLLAAMDR